MRHQLQNNKTMNPQKLFNLTSPLKEMPSEVLEALLENAVLEYGSDTDYYFKSKHGNYEMLFGFDGETMSVDTFGFKHNKGWIELQPTNAQYSEMKRKLDNAEREIEHEPLPYVDEYLDNGVRREDFY